MLAAASSANCAASQFGRKLRIGSLFGPLPSTSAGNTAMVEHAAVTFRVETNSSCSSASSSSCQASSNISEFFPRETVNPPPSPITESIYTSLPPSILKQPGISRKASMSTSSGSSGPRNDGFSSLSFETLGNDKDSDQRIIATVGNLGRAGVGSSQAVYDSLGTSGKPAADCTKPQECRCGGNCKVPDVPIEPREQAEGAEDENPSGAARAPFAQILDSAQKPTPVNETTNE
ncbi:unnamed protein product [Dibothriocephalus latus]|uniref:Uncharacterized protein n=1 Tax=Dibothriocephalus latus TaxID=60516 RepID=A0A3P7LT67_DIBLA|nr:unnamed protein product [Dibothriocephalus latus]